MRRTVILYGLSMAALIGILKAVEYKYLVRDIPLEFYIGLPADVHAALVLRAPNGSPNVGPELDIVHSVHDDLPAFVRHWLAR